LRLGIRRRCRHASADSIACFWACSFSTCSRADRPRRIAYSLEAAASGASAASTRFASSASRSTPLRLRFPSPPPPRASRLRPQASLPTPPSSRRAARARRGHAGSPAPWSLRCALRRFPRARSPPPRRQRAPRRRGTRLSALRLCFCLYDALHSQLRADDVLHIRQRGGFDLPEPLRVRAAVILLQAE